MKWVRINKAHFNTSLIEAFYWMSGSLFVYWRWESGVEKYEDPDRKNYLRLCTAVGVKPLEVDGYGKS